MKFKNFNLLMFIVTAVSCGILVSCGGGSKEEKVTTNTQSKDGKPSIEWVEIAGGTFMMGSPGTEVNRKADEVMHEVTLKPYKLSKHEITVAQFKAFVDATGYKTLAETGADGFVGSSIWTGTKFEQKQGVNWRHDALGNLLAEGDYNHPVTHVSWDDAYAFAKWMGCRLPTEAEWEFGARAGTFTAYSTGNCLSSDQANYNANFPGGKCAKGQYRAKTMPVGSLPANSLGLFDMHGNIAEWCYDYYSEYPTTPQNNPMGPDNGSNRVIRGGSWRDNGATCRSAARLGIFHGRVLSFAGFRVAAKK